MEKDSYYSYEISTVSVQNFKLDQGNFQGTIDGVFVVASPSLEATLDVTCNGTLSLVVERAGKTLTATATGGTPPYNFDLNGAGLAPANTFELTVNGRYTVKVKDSKNCEGEYIG